MAGGGAAPQRGGSGQMVESQNGLAVCHFGKFRVFRVVSSPGCAKQVTTVPHESAKFHRIYIVDDESMLAEVAHLILSQEGYTTQVFVDPVEALSSFTRDEEKPRLLVTDCVMGGMDGLELIRRCREQDPALKTILLSGTVTAEFVEKQPVSPDRFIPKPYNVQVLIDAVNDLLDK